jgi:hypothetical protein
MRHMRECRLRRRFPDNAGVTNLSTGMRGILVCHSCEDFFVVIVEDHIGGSVVGLHCRTCHTTIPVNRGALISQPCRNNDDCHAFLLWRGPFEQSP